MATEHRVSFTFAELKATYLGLIRGKFNFQIAGNRDKANNLKPRWAAGGDFFGVSSEEMAIYLEKGYRVEGLQLSPALRPARERRKIRMNDLEGEFQYDLWKSGEDMFFVEHTPRASVPGISFRFGFDFSATVSESTIRAYQSWLLRAILSLENSGINCSISAEIRMESIDSQGRHNCETEIVVKRAGERLDFVLWSAMFAPGSFRHIGFTAVIASAEKAGLTVDYSLGKPNQTGSFHCHYDAENSAIVANCASRGNPRFSEEEMTESFRKALDKAMGN